MPFHHFAFILLSLFTGACQQGSEQVNPMSVHQVVDAGFSGNLAGGSSEAPTEGLVYRSIDGGKSWQDITSGLPGEFKPTTVFAQNGEIMLGSMNGLYRNKTALPMEPVWEREHLLDVLQQEFINNIIPNSKGAIARTFPNGFYQNMPGTGIWKPVYRGLTYKEVNDVITRANGTVLISTHNGIYRDVYGSDMWGKVFAQGQVLSMIETEGVILGSGEIGVLRSTDGGDHWQWVLTDDGHSRKTVLIQDAVYAISMGGGTRAEFEADPLRTAARLRRSVDGGKTWELLDKEHVLGQQIYDIVPLKDALLCSSRNGLFLSLDQGRHWELIRAPVENKITSIAVDGQAIYAVPSFGGC